MTNHTRPLSEIPRQAVVFRGDDRVGIEVYEWYCEHCQEWVGWPDVDAHPAVICDDPVECPHSVDWETACGFVVCEWCHEPASERAWTGLTGEDEQIILSID